MIQTLFPTSFKLGFPLEAVVGNWVAIERKGTQLQELPQSARAENVAVGKASMWIF